MESKNVQVGGSGSGLSCQGGSNRQDGRRIRMSEGFSMGNVKLTMMLGRMIDFSS
jgi:hypothetical protein